MKHTITFFAVLMMAMAVPAKAQNYLFTDTLADGQVLYFDTLNGEARLVRPGTGATYNNYVTGNIVIPSTVTYNSVAYTVTSLAYSSFEFCSGLTSVTIPNTVLSIGNCVFMQCTNLETVVLSNSLQKIGAYAFDRCTNLQYIEIPNSVVSIDKLAFYKCEKMDSITIGTSVRYIGFNAFGSCDSLKSITFPCSLDTIGYYLFHGMGQSHVTNIWFKSATPPIIYLDAASSATNNAMTFNSINDLWGYPSPTNVNVYIPIGSLSAYSLSWNPSNNFTIIEENTSPYEVSVSTNNNQMGNVSYYILNCEGTSVKIEATPSNSYYFREWSNGSTNNPDTLTLTSDTSLTAIFVPDVTTQICMVSVQDSHNVVMWNKENDGVIATYNIYREGNVTGEYELIWSQPFDSMSAWIDTTSRPSSRSYRYRMTATDIYGYESAPSEVHKTMHLTINQGMGYQWNLMWTEYEGAEFVTYMIYRGNYWNGLELISQMPVGGNTTYTDENVPYGTVYYQVVAVKSSPCNTTKSESLIRSNIATNDENVGIDNMSIDGINVFPKGKHIIIEGLNGQSVIIYSIDGRTIASLPKATGHIAIPVSPTGVYVVKIGDLPAKKVVVIR